MNWEDAVYRLNCLINNLLVSMLIRSINSIGMFVNRIIKGQLGEVESDREREIGAFQGLGEAINRETEVGFEEFRRQSRKSRPHNRRVSSPPPPTSLTRSGCFVVLCVKVCEIYRILRISFAIISRDTQRRREAAEYRETR